MSKMATRPMRTNVVKTRRPAMVNVAAKAVTRRIARAEAVVDLPAAVAACARRGEILSRKGPVFHTAAIAGILAAKKTSELVPMCHPIAIEDCRVDLALKGRKRVVIECRVEAHHKTGVEMEAMVGAATAALTVYDMCKGLSHGIVIRSLRLLEKQGGKSTYRVR
jgi:cyclic pyranopterin monophosphate synthase